MADARQALTVEQVASMLRVSKSGVYNLIKNGEIESYQVGRKIRLSEANVADYIEKTKKPTKRTAAPTISALESNNYFDLSVEKRAGSGFIICGQDLILDILSNFMRLQGVPALRAYIGSYDSLTSLYHDRVSVATAHLWDSAADDYNISYVRALVPGTRCVVINVTYRMQGLYVAKGNPKNIRSWSDFGRDDISMINREKGAGSRVLLDENIKILGLNGSKIAGYDNENQSHLTVASAVGRGEADVAVGSEKIARHVENVDFVPLKKERYDLVFKRDQLETHAIQKMLEVLRSRRFQSEFADIGGYDIADIGKVMAET